MSSLAGWAGSSSKEDSIPKRLAAIEARLRELTAERSLESASIGAGGLTSSNFDGTLDPAAAGTTGWGLSGSTGDAIFNDIVLRGGIIGNDALTNPITAQRVQTFDSVFSIGTSFASKLADNLIVPDGFPSVIIFASGHISAINSRGSAGLLQMRMSVNGFAGFPQANEAGPSEYTQVSHSYATTLGTLAFASPLVAGDNIPIAIEAAVDAGTWSPVGGSDNLVALSILGLFLR